MILVIIINLISSTGQVGYIITGMRSSKEALIGDTLYHNGTTVQPLAGLAPAKPMVCALIHVLLYQCHLVVIGIRWIISNGPIRISRSKVITGKADS